MLENQLLKLFVGLSALDATGLLAAVSGVLQQRAAAMAGPTTMMTASVWGQGRAALQLSQRRGLQPGEEECMICRDEVPASVSFQPCGHKVCFTCVENMRAKNIFKKDVGVKCPFCRAYVDGYQAATQRCGGAIMLLIEPKTVCCQRFCRYQHHHNAPPHGHQPASA